jgi:hypothetical protein|tara:strand:+ start:411 stop:566 length:156 start_codon:yes stop_codon:yes gene_type:complete
MNKQIKLTIKAKDIKVSTGHKQHLTGSGAWDNRPKRKRTRQAQRAAWRKEW